MPQSIPFARSGIFQPSLTVADLLLRSGQDQAEAERRRGEISAQLWGNLGNTIARIPEQIQQVKTQQIQQKGLQTRNALESAQLTDVQNQQKFRTDLGDVLKNTPQVDEDGVSVWNLKDIASQLAEKGHGAYTGDVVKSLGGLNDSFRAERAARLAVVQRGAQEIARTGNDPMLAAHFLDQLEKNGTYDAATVGKYRDFIQADPANVAKLTAALSGAPQTAVVPEGATVINKNTNQPVFTGTPKPPTREELAVAAAKGDPQAAAALAALRAPTPPRPIEEQLLEAIAKGDTQKADQIKQTLRTAAESRRDPGAAALANELGSLRKEEAQARLDALNKKAEPLDVSPDIQTTAAGRAYIDLSSYSAAERDKAREAASASGAVAVSKEQANALQEIDNARMNQKSILTQIGDLLPKDAAGRPLAAAGATIAKYFQTDEQKAAFNSWRTAAIQTLRATAGAKGLRINQAEIAQAIENDIPKLTDTIGTAQQKVKNINTMLDNAEKSILIRDRSAAAPTSGTIEGVTYKVRPPK